MGVDFSNIELTPFYELYRVEYLSQVYYYTSADHTITFQAHNYIPAAIKRDPINKENDLNNIKLNITFPANALFKKYLAQSPVYETTITIILYQDATHYQEIFKGRLTKISFDMQNCCKVEVDEFSSLTIKLPRLLVQPACNHVLFSPECALDKEDYREELTVISLHSNYFTTNAAGYPSQYFQTGTLEFNGDKRWIVYHMGDDIFWHAPFDNLQVDDVVTAYPGCNKSPAMCQTRFNNLLHYLGCPYVPRKNPVLNGI